MRHKAILEMKIVSGWRIYDNSKQIIIDENKFTELKEFSAFGSSNKEAESKLPYRGSALKESAGDFAGFQYGKRILLFGYRQERVFYSGKEEKLKKASKNVKSNQWDDAINIWKDMANINDKKIASKAAYNMALASEIKGYLDARLIGQKSKALGDKRANSYISILNKRKQDQIKLNKQLNN